jgi:2-dehydropantoate 2-reductase
MRILVVGAGATGGYFGGRLAQAGRDVAFLVRPARAAQLEAEGLRITSPHGDVTLRPRLVTAGQLASAYDVVLLSVKAYALESALEDLAPAVGPATMIVPMLNGMRHLDLLAKRFGDPPVLGGVCVVATTLDERGRIVQLAEAQDLVYGELDGTASARVGALDALMQGSSFAARASRRIVQEMWDKWVFLATLGGITCLLRGTVGEIEAAPGGAVLAEQLLSECAAVAAASGCPLAPATAARIKATVTAKGSPLASSMYRDLQRGRSVEVDHILGDLRDRARRLGVPAPLLAAAFAHLRIYQQRLPAP